LDRKNVMAKEIDLSELTEDGDMSTPPPAQPPPSLTHNGPPLPVGRAVRAINPKSLTDAEREKLGDIGWVEGEPIPDNMADLIAAAEANAQAEVTGPLPLPVSPDTPPVTIDPTPIEDLPQAKQTELRKHMDAALSEAADNAATAQQNAAVGAQSDSARKVVSAAMSPQNLGEAGEPDRPATRTVPDVGFDAQTQAEELAAKAETIEEKIPELPPGPSHCPHCSWDMARLDIEPPDQIDRMSFLQSLLGAKPYTKRISLLGDKFHLTLRTLTASEADLAFAQAYTDRDNNEFMSELDFWEKVNRYRLYLQIVKVERDGRGVDDFPDGLDKTSNPNAEEHWKFPEGTTQPLKLVEQHMQSKILTTEHLSRILQVEVNRFNQQVSKMEAMVDNTDFWKATEQPSS
jgi:hypothetical protein